MGIKDKIIFALGDPNTDDKLAVYKAHRLMYDLRCENCRHWIRHVEIAYGTCGMLHDGPVSTSGDFFCALFEAQ